MKPSDVARTLRALLPTKRPLYLWGPPGVGKSSLVKQAAAELDLKVLDLRAVLLDPVDLRGLPTVNANRALWCPPAFLPTDGAGVLFLDELAQAAPLVQSACLQLVLDRAIGDYQLPPGWAVMAASNRQEDQAGAHKLITPLLNRFIHVDLDVSHEDWQAWAVKEEIATEVRSFLNFRPALLFDFRPQEKKRAFATPRSWEFVSSILETTPRDLQHAVFSGTVGEGPAAEFLAFLEVYRDLPDPDEVLADPSRAIVPKLPAVLFALCGALAERCRTADRATLGRFLTYIGRLPSEFGVLAIRDACSANRGVISAPGASEFLKKHKHLLLDK